MRTAIPVVILFLVAGCERAKKESEEDPREEARVASREESGTVRERRERIADFRRAGYELERALEAFDGIDGERVRQAEDGVREALAPLEEEAERVGGSFAREARDEILAAREAELKARLGNPFAPGGCVDEFFAIVRERARREARAEDQNYEIKP